MTRRTSLSTKILLLAVTNILALAVAAVVFLYVQLGGDFDSFLLTPARERILAVARAFALEVSETTPDQLERLTDRYASAYGVRVVLVTNDGQQLTGAGDPIPETVRARVVDPDVAGPRGFGRGRRPPPPDDPAGLGPGADEPPEGPVRMPGAPPFLIAADGPMKYWIAVRIPVRERGQRDTRRGTLLFASSSLLGNPFYFQPLPWIAVVVFALAVTIACWLPFVRGLTRSVSDITAVSREIAEGRFDVAVPSDRRDELGILADAIREMAAQLKTLVESQKRFLSDAAHELRSPLARITMATGLLERDATAATRRHVDDLLEEVELMTHLTDDLLAFARAERINAVHLAPVSVADAVQQAIRLEAKGTEVRVDVDPSLRVVADAALLGRALSNVLRNAVDHAALHGPITVSAREDGQHAYISVADEGPGVPDAEMPRMFVPFHRLESSRDRRSGGVGLGLAIVQSAMVACGGLVSCRNLSPKGFEVTLRLPVSARSQSTA